MLTNYHTHTCTFCNARFSVRVPPFDGELRRAPFRPAVRSARVHTNEGGKRFITVSKHKHGGKLPKYINNWKYTTMSTHIHRRPQTNAHENTNTN